MTLLQLWPNKHAIFGLWVEADYLQCKNLPLKLTKCDFQLFRSQVTVLCDLLRYIEISRYCSPLLCVRLYGCFPHVLMTLLCLFSRTKPAPRHKVQRRQVVHRASVANPHRGPVVVAELSQGHEVGVEVVRWIHQWTVCHNYHQDGLPQPAPSIQQQHRWASPIELCQARLFWGWPNGFLSILGQHKGATQKLGCSEQLKLVWVDWTM